MASIHKEVLIQAPPEAVWDAVRDVGQIHIRLARGFVTNTRLVGPDRMVTFANGTQALERIVTIDDEARRLAYSVASDRLTHHNASIQVIPDGEDHSRFVWIADLLPDAFADYVSGQMEAGATACKATLEGMA